MLITVVFGLVIVALLMALVSLVIAVKGNVPLNRKMDHWSPLEPPKDWEHVRDRWLHYHYWRGKAEMIGFLALLSAALLYTQPVSNG